jgi:uncharacterized protein YuzE
MKSMRQSLKLKIDYDPETDTLSLWNGRPACEGGEVGEGLTADFDADGEVVGITLDGAVKLLTPYLGDKTAPNKSK